MNESKDTGLTLTSFTDLRTEVTICCPDRDASVSKDTYVIESNIAPSPLPNVGQDTPKEDLMTRFLKRIPHIGIFLAVVSSFAFCVCSVIVKQVTSVDPSFLATFRFVGIFLPSLGIIVWNRMWPFPRQWMLKLLFRSIFGATSLILKFYAVRLMPLADASVIVFSSPVVVVIFARIFLKESCNIFRVFMVIFTLSGIVLITRPPFMFGEADANTHSDVLWGAGAALTSVLFAASVYIFLRDMREVDSTVILFNYGWIGLLATFVLSASVSELTFPSHLWEQLSLLLMGLLSFFGQYCLTKALQFEEAGPVSVARSSDVVFAFFWQIAIFQEMPHPLSIVGALLVSFSVLFIVLTKWAEKMLQDSKLKQFLFCTSPPKDIDLTVDDEVVVKRV